MDSSTFNPRGGSTMGGRAIYNSPGTGQKGSGPQSEVNVKAKSGGTGLRNVLENTGSNLSDYSGLSVPALLALGFIAWWLFHTY